MGGTESAQTLNRVLVTLDSYFPLLNVYLNLLQEDCCYGK